MQWTFPIYSKSVYGKRMSLSHSVSYFLPLPPAAKVVPAKAAAAKAESSSSEDSSDSEDEAAAATAKAPAKVGATGALFYCALYKYLLLVGCSV